MSIHPVPRPASQHPIYFTRHAVWRYQQRLTPNVKMARARRQVETAAKIVGARSFPPPWFKSHGHKNNAYLVIGEKVVVPLMKNGNRFVATTCIVLGKS